MSHQLRKKIKKKKSKALFYVVALELQEKQHDATENRNRDHYGRKNRMKKKVDFRRPLSPGGQKVESSDIIIW